MSYRASTYGWTTQEAPCSCPYLAPLILGICQNLRPSSVCDVGSGNGALAGLLHAKGYDVVGIEADRDGVALAQAAYPTIVFHNLAIEDSPASVIEHRGSHFDLVVTTEVVEHLFSPHLLIEFSSKLLSDGGHIVISTPYHGFLKNLMLSVFNRWDSHHTALWHGGHIKFWSRKTLTKLVEEEGFKVIGFQGAGRIPLLWKGMIITAKKI
jgi:2-polyprenyl-3-methyl-5-hydroxy-6-metoxy-1,4-benzoquinol methylase